HVRFVGGDIVVGQGGSTLYRQVLTVIAMSGTFLACAQPPAASIANEHLKVQLYLPDASNGFYKSTRFDWSGVISRLEFAGHTIYGPWFTKHEPGVRDFVYREGDIVV